ncbi:hypothetical protein QP933_10620, partial [Corynebacterium pseudodiphtheriticum]|uniref:hypothetical protein n=1 Tax=Corynebacterium pseudodiphtheriticum TaxID=37637 RepID=UPI00254A5514
IVVGIINALFLCLYLRQSRRYGHTFGDADEILEDFVRIPDLDHNGGFGPGSDAKNLRQSSAARWYLATCGFPAAMGQALR